MTDRPEINLGDPRCFVIQTNKGLATAIRAEVALLKKRGEWAMVYDSPSITSKGYNRLNQVAGISIVSPPTIGDKPNPFYEYDGDGISRVEIRKIGIGYSPIGSITIIDETVNFDIKSYLKQHVFKKWREHPNIGTFSANPEEPIANKLFVPIIGNMGILLDMGHEESLKITSEFVQRQKFAERIAASIARRNVLKAHPAIATSNVVFRDNAAIVIVYGYKLDMSRKQIEGAIEATAEGKPIEGTEVIAHETNADEAELACENDIADPEADSNDAQTDNPIQDDSEKLSILSKILAMRSLVGRKIFDEIVTEKVFSATEDEQKALLKKLMNIKSGKTA